MATATQITAAILQASSGQGLNGAMMQPLAAGIGQAVAVWLPKGVTVKCGTVGFAGAGVLTGTLTVPPLPGAAILFASQGMQGPQSASLATAISIGIATSVSGSTFTGPSASVGMGTALAKVTSANQADLVAMLVQNLPATFNSEVQTQTQIQLASAVGTIISAQLLLAFGVGMVVGSVSPVSAVGTTTCAVVVP